MTKPPAESVEPEKSDVAETNIAHRTRNASRRDSSNTKEVPAKKVEPQPRQRKQRQKPDYIPPLNRKLGPYEDILNPPVSTSSSMDPVDFELRKYVGLIVKASPISPAFTQEFVEELSDLSTTYMNHLISLLHGFTEVQRHHKAGVSDLHMCFQTNNIAMSDLYGEYEKTRSLPAEIKSYTSKLRDRLDTVLLEYQAEKYTLEKDDPSLVFHANEQYEIAALVPRQSEPRTYIPSYFPDLPPDFTYQNTGSYMETITDLKQIKMKLVEESRLNEKSLYKLIEDDGNTWMDTLEGDIKALNSDLESDEEDIMSVSGADGTDVESPAAEIDGKGDEMDVDGEKDEQNDERADDVEMLDVKENVDKKDKEKENNEEKEKDEENEKSKENVDSNDVKTADAPVAPKTSEQVNTEVGTKIVTGSIETDEVKAAPAQSTAKNDSRFDFVEYARKRRRAKDAEFRAIEKRRQKRLRNIFMKAEKLFSCYATSQPNLEDIEYFNEYLDSGFKRVIMATRQAEKNKMEKLARLQQEKALRDQEQEAQNGAFEFGFAFNPASNLLDDSDDDGDELQDIVFDEPESGNGGSVENQVNEHNSDHENFENGQIAGSAENDAPATTQENPDSIMGIMDYDDIGSKIDGVLTEADPGVGVWDDAESDEDLEDI